MQLWHTKCQYGVGTLIMWTWIKVCMTDRHETDIIRLVSVLRINIRTAPTKDVVTHCKHHSLVQEYRWVILDLIGLQAAWNRGQHWTYVLIRWQRAANVSLSWEERCFLVWNCFDSKVKMITNTCKGIAQCRNKRRWSCLLIAAGCIVAIWSTHSSDNIDHHNTDLVSSRSAVSDDVSNEITKDALVETIILSDGTPLAEQPLINITKVSSLLVSKSVDYCLPSLKCS